MFRNCLAAAFRNLLRNRLYAAINVVGLSVGFAAAIFAALFVRDELTYERWIPGHERIYGLATTIAPAPGAGLREFAGAPRDAASWLKAEFGEVAAAARIEPQGMMVVRAGALRRIEPWSAIVAVDPQFFAAVPVPGVAGDLESALEAPDSVVLTRRTARAYFGRDAPLGEVLDLDQHPMRVTAVIEDWPSNTLFSAAAFISSRAPFSSLSHLEASADAAFALVDTYVRLKPHASIATLAGEMPALVERHMPREDVGEVKVRLRPLAAVHLDPLDNAFAGKDRALLLAVIYGVTGIGVLIVLAAAINFVNVMTARASRRAVEVGVRKVAGAERRQLILQFMGESVIYAGLGMVLALGLVRLLLPAFQALIDRAIAFHVMRDPALDLGIAALALATGALAGIYPAFILSSLRPAAVLKSGVVKTSGSEHVRQGLVVLQFAILISLAVGTAAVYRQTLFALNESIRFDKDETLTIERGCNGPFKTAVKALAGVRRAACAWGVGMDYRDETVTRSSGLGASDFGIAPVDFEFFEVYGLAPIAARFFDPARGEDVATPDPAHNPNVVINETAVRALGFASPGAAIGETIAWHRLMPGGTAPEGHAGASRIIGVVADISAYESVDRPTIPKLFYADPAMLMMPIPGGQQGVGTLNVKLTGRAVPETLRAIDQLWAKLGDAGWPIERRFLDEQLQEQYRYIIRQAQLFAVFAGVALFIAALGLFALAAFTAERRTKEIGIRKAMGAGRGDILKLLLWEFAKPVLLANLIAWPAAYLIMQRWLAGFVHHVALAPWMFLGASGMALVIAVATVAGHALLVARSEPVSALRYE